MGNDKVRYLGKRWSQSETDKNLDLRDEYLVYIGYYWLLSVQVQLGVIRCIQILLVLYMLYLVHAVSSSETEQNLGLRSKYLVCIDYFWLLSVQVQFGVIRCISSFWRPCIYFWLKYLGIFVLLSWYVTGIILTSKWPSKAPGPLVPIFSNHAKNIGVSLWDNFSEYFRFSKCLKIF